MKLKIGSSKKKTCVLVLVSILTIFLILSIVNAAQPRPHTIKGTVYDSTGSTGVENGIPVLINDTTNGESVLTYIYAPPSKPGLYSTSIDGTDGDMVLVTVWNATHYGNNSAVLISTTTIDVNLNMTRPSETNVSIIIPSNDTVKNISQVFNVTANITAIGGQDGTGCYARINFSDETVITLYQDNYIHSLSDLTLGSNIITTWNITGIKDGVSNITVISYCDSDEIIFDDDNIDTVYNIQINDTIPPNVSLVNPSNNSWSNNENITFYYNVTDPSDIQSCAIYLDDVLQTTNNTVVSGAISQFELEEIPEGNHSWFVSCHDNSSNLNQGNSTTRYVNVDLTEPYVRLKSPDNDNISYNNTVVFEYNVTDTYGEIDNCSLILNGTAYATNYSVLLNITQNFTNTLEPGYYSWQVLCFDKANNSNASTTWYINITDPDLAVYDNSITFSTETPVENQQITINATIYNLGNENATNIIVQFFEDSPYDTQIGSNITINLSIGENKTVNRTWTSKVGSYNIYVVVDPKYELNGSFSEFDESNNLANKTIFIPAYNYYYGNVTADIKLASMSSNFVFSWFNETNVNGNIYVVDSDSSVTWSSLLAVGTNITNKSSQDDFEEIDTALNLTDLVDSINLTYTKNGLYVANDSFLIYSNNISNVPVVNSTNTSNFMTGILWDSNDDNPGEYNGSQDLVFVTKINKAKQGAYGNYDYEIKVPANLKRYITPDDDTTLEFYAELI